MQGSVTKLKRCPECKTWCDGKSCRCGWIKKDFKRMSGKITKIYQSCPYCDAVGNQRDGLCELHAKVADLSSGIIHQLGFRNGENDLVIYQGADNFVVSILNTLHLDDQLRKGWEDYRQKILERIKKLTFENEPKKPEEENENALHFSSESRHDHPKRGIRTNVQTNKEENTENDEDIPF